MNIEDENSCKHVFDILDANKNGSLDIEEFSKAARALGLNPTEADIQDVLSEYDTDKDGVLNFSEFMRLVRLVRVGNESSLEDILNIYNKCFPDNGGFISTDDLKSILTGQGEPLKDHEVQQIIGHFDKDKSGRIHVETLIKGLIG